MLSFTVFTLIFRMLTTTHTRKTTIEHIRKAAGAMVSDNDHGGCAQAVYEYLLA